MVLDGNMEERGKGWSLTFQQARWKQDSCFPRVTFAYKVHREVLKLRAV